MNVAARIGPLLAVLLAAVGGTRASAQIDAEPPYPPSPVIRSIAWHPETLKTAAPGSETPTTYAYDPDDPVMCKGGSHSWCWGDNPYAPVRSYDQSEQEARSDVLVFKTGPLQRERKSPVRSR